MHRLHNRVKNLETGIDHLANSHMGVRNNLPDKARKGNLHTIVAYAIATAVLISASTQPLFAKAEDNKWGGPRRRGWQPPNPPSFVAESVDSQTTQTEQYTAQKTQEEEEYEMLLEWYEQLTPSEQFYFHEYFDFHMETIFHWP